MIGRMNSGKQQQPSTNSLHNINGRVFRFQTRGGYLLTDQIASIEALATERLLAGVSYESVQIGALALLRLALEGVSSRLHDSSIPSVPIQAFSSVPESLRCGALEG